VNVLLVTRRYPPFGGGAENQFCRIAEALMFRRHSVIVLTGSHQPGTVSREQNHGILVRRLYDLPIRVFGTCIFLVILTFQMIRYRRHYEVVITSMINETSSVVVLTANLLRKKVCLYPSAVGPIGNTAWARAHWCGALFQWAARRADLYICQSENFYPEFIEFGIDRKDLWAIPNTISRNFLKIGDNRSPAMDTVKTMRILWCGRLAEEKDPEIVLEVAKILQSESVNTVIDIVGGGGPLEPILRQRLSADPALSEIAQLHGNPADVLPFFSAADIFLLTSRDDAMPLVIIEAMAAGIPIVATAVGGIPDMVQDEATGLLIPSGDADAMAKAICRLIKSPELRRHLVDKARLYVMQHHHPDRIAEAYEGIFDHLLPTSGSMAIG